MTDVTPTPLLKARRKWRLIDSPEALAECVVELRAHSGEFAIDAERASGFKYSQRAYLIQISRRQSDIFLIDPFTISPSLSTTPFESLADLLATDAWILHAATQDLTCLREIGLIPKALIDTELGSRIAGLPRVGLGAVVEHYLGLQLAKEHSAVDWSTRPLQLDWLEYAALDVDVLHELADALLSDLARQNKSSFAEEEFRHLLSFRPKAERIDKWRGASGLHEVKDQRGLAIARALWQARESLAKKMDVAPGRLIPDSSISHVAKQQTKSRPELASDRSFSGRASRSYLDTWWEAIETGRNSNDLPPLRLPATGIPNHRLWPNKYPEAHKRLMAAKAFVAQISELLNIPAENLLTPDYLRQLCWLEPPTVTEESVADSLTSFGARTWQIEVLAAGLANSLVTAPSYEITKPSAESTDPAA